MYAFAFAAGSHVSGLELAILAFAFAAGFHVSGLELAILVQINVLVCMHLPFQLGLMCRDWNWPSWHLLVQLGFMCRDWN